DLQLSEAEKSAEGESKDRGVEKKFKLGVPSLKKGNGKISNYGKNKLPGWSGRNGLWTWILFGVAVILLVSIYSRPDFSTKEIPYSEFKAMIQKGEIRRVILSPNVLKGFSEEEPEKGTTGVAHVPSTFYMTVAVEDRELIPLMDKMNVKYEAENVAL